MNIMYLYKCKNIMAIKKVCFKRRINLYFKCIAIISLAIFYFGFLFRESLNAFEASKNGERISMKNEIKKNIFLPKQRRIRPLNTEVQKQHIRNEEKRYESKGKKYIMEDVDGANIASNFVTATTLNPVYEYSEELHSAIERKLLDRKTHLQNICSKEKLFGIYPPKSQEFFVSSGHSLVWCNVFKAASSTWMYYFNLLGGYNIKYLQSTKTSPLELARTRFPRPKSNELQDALTTSLSFLIVREPFERLLSAYRDKLEGCRNKFYKVLGKQIIKSIRKSAKLKRHNSGPTFKEFILFLIRNSKLNKHFDEHWTPIYNFCTPCSINYTLIAKVETFQRDSEYIIRQAGLEPLLLGKLPKKKIKAISNHSTHNTTSLIERYFSKIDRKILNELLEIYRLDFELFGYNYTKYYDIVGEPLIGLSSSITPAIPSILSNVSTTTNLEMNQ